MSDRTKKSRSLGLDSDPLPDSSSTPRPKATRTNSVPVNDKRSSAPIRSASKARKPSVADRDSRISQRTTRSEPSQATRRPSRGETRTSRPAGDVLHFNLVVLGAVGVSKSNFIQQALDLRNPSLGPVSSSKISIDGTVYHCQLWELLPEDVECNGGKGVIWPKFINAIPLPHIDGVLCLYDTDKRESLTELAELLRILLKSTAPFVSLVATHGDKASNGQVITEDLVAQIISTGPTHEDFEVPPFSAESQRRCLVHALRSILAVTTVHPTPLPTRSPGPGTSNTFEQRDSNRQESRAISGRQSRSASRTPIQAHPGAVLDAPSSEESGVEDINHDGGKEKNCVDKPGSSEEVDEATGQHEDDMLASRGPLRVDTTSSSPHHSSRPSDPQTPLSPNDYATKYVGSGLEEDGSRIPQTPDSFALTSVLRPGTADTDNQGQTFLDLEDESQDESSQNEIEKSTSSLDMGTMKIDRDSQPETGVTFDELVDRLLRSPVANKQQKFVSVFLCLYRAFATPKQLLQAVISRFDNVGNSDDAKFTKAADQLRYLGVLTEWTANYPGDFTDPSVRQIASNFTQRLEKSKVFRHAAKELSNDLTVEVDDDDAVWAFVDPSDPPLQLQTTITGRPINTRMDQSPPKPGKVPIVKDADEDEDSTEEDTDIEGASSPRHSGAPSTSASSFVKPTNASSQSLTNLWKIELARDKAQKLRSIPRNPLSKIQWHQFMETPSVDFAIGVTRIDWTMYSAIRPREFVRHVMTKQKEKTTDNIAAMVKQFNHLAVFVSGMILLRDKPKHRAKALEKFMTIAWKVRQLNDYNALGAIVAGINGHEIYRLGQTRELVPQAVLKDFMRLTILMSHSRSHSAYRMAWENSFSARIPFLPLLRQDLTMAQSGSRTFVGSDNDKINWKKFEIMGDVVYSIQKSQALPYKVLVHNEDVEKLILDTKILQASEDSADPRSELYDRSVQLEPVGASIDPTRKKFDWFRMK